MNEFLHLLHDPAHWGFEIVSDAAFTLIGAFFGRIWLRKHDREVHGS